jgi:predicted permease
LAGVNAVLIAAIVGSLLVGFAISSRSGRHEVHAERCFATIYWGQLATSCLVLPAAPVRHAGIAVVATIVAQTVVLGLAVLYARRRFADTGARAAFTLVAFWPNAGFLGIPIAVALLGRGALPTAVLFSAVASGPHAFVAGGSIAAAHAHAGWGAVRTAIRRNHYLPVTVLALGWAALQLPTWEVATRVGSDATLLLTIPAFVGFGIVLARSPLRPDLDTWVATAFRLGLGPAALGACALAVSVPRAFLIQSAMAPGVTTLSLAARYRLPMARVAPTVALATGLVLVGTVAALALR